MNREEDIVLVTVDCWRYDDLPEMAAMRGLADEWTSGSCICASPHTPGAFPAIFASTYFHDFYVDGRTIPEGTPSLPRLLAGEGYATGAFVASNAMLDAWSGHFDTYWNDGFRADGVDESERVAERTTLRKAWSFLTLNPPLSARDVFARADRWWADQSRPRFLWVHLMDPHDPYLPGLRRGLAAGPARTYASLLLTARHHDNVNFHGEFPAWARHHLKRLHVECARRLDAPLYEWLQQYRDDATVVITGDHGEEFDHGLMTHARLYDETVRVPFLTNESELSTETGYVRQQDIAPTLLDRLGIDRPDGWDGRPVDASMPTQSMIGSLRRYDRPFWLGVRSEEWKLIRRYSDETGLSDPEVYDLNADPRETDPLDPGAAPDALEAHLDAFVDSDSIRDTITDAGGFIGDEHEKTRRRLQELGYIQ